MVVKSNKQKRIEEERKAQTFESAQRGQSFQIGTEKLTQAEYEEAKKQIALGSEAIIPPSVNVQNALASRKFVEPPKSAQAQALSQTPVPRAEELAAQTGNPLKEASQVGLKNSGINIIAQSNLGQSINAKAFLDELKNNPEAQQKYAELRKYMLDNKLNPEQVTDDPLIQGALQLSLNENDFKILDKGKADVKGLAITIEGLPISSQLTKWTGGALTPTSAFNKIKDLDKQVSDLTSQMDKWNEAITKNPQLSNQYESLVRDTEQKIYDLQSRIKLMTIQSPILQNSPEEVENLQVNIDTALTQTTKIKSVIINTRGY